MVTFNMSDITQTGDKTSRVRQFNDYQIGTVTQMGTIVANVYQF
jgi:hypothetical protein